MVCKGEKGGNVFHDPESIAHFRQELLQRQKQSLKKSEFEGTQGRKLRHSFSNNLEDLKSSNQFTYSH